MLSYVLLYDGFILESSLDPLSMCMGRYAESFDDIILRLSHFLSCVYLPSGIKTNRVRKLKLDITDHNSLPHPARALKHFK